MSSDKNRILSNLTGSGSRRDALHAGGALLAGLGALMLPRGVAAQATPTAGGPGKGLLLVQSFSHGTLFPTQGDAGGPPYTVILWDAADRGFFFTDSTSGSAGVVPAEGVLTALSGEAGAVREVLVAAPAEASGATVSSQRVWALSQVTGSLGSDPGAVTYQGEVLNGEDAAAFLGGSPEDPPDGPQDLGAGFLILAGLSGFDPGDDGGVQLDLL